MTVSGDADDETLAARAGLGDHAAFETVALRYQARVYRLAARLVGPNDASDVVQDTFLSAFRHLHRFRGESRFSTWLYRIATNAALMHRRARARRPAESLERFMPSFEEDGSHCGTPPQLKVAARAEALIERRQLAERLTEALERLPDPYRSAFVLRDLEELSTAEVAEILDAEPAAIRQRVHRARLIMRGLLTSLVGGSP